MDKRTQNLLMGWYASTQTKSGPMTQKDKALLKWLGVILGAVAFINLLFLALMLWINERKLCLESLLLVWRFL